MEHVLNEDYPLDLCTVCNLIEGGLTTDCCGENTSTNTMEDVYDGKLDYREDEGGWVRKLNPTNQSWVKGNIYDMLMDKEGALTSKNEIMLSYGVDKEQYKEIEKELLKQLYEVV